MILDENFILEKAAELCRIKKAHQDKLTDVRFKREVSQNPALAYPEYYDGYQEVCGNYDKILVHSMYGVFPDHLFITRAPNMEEKEFEYIKANYKQITLPVFIDFNTSVYKAFNDGNWNIVIPESFNTGNDTLGKYIEEEIGQFRSLETWMKTIVIPCKLRDAMGVVAVKPNYHYINSDSENEDIYSIDDSKRPEPIPVYYTCKQVLTKCDEKFTAILLDEKSKVKYNNKIERAGMIIEFYDDESIWRVEQIGNKVDCQFKIVRQEVTGLKHRSCVYMMGNPMIKKDSFVYESPFLYSVDILDLMSVTQSYVQASEAKCVFPFTVMVGNECDFSNAAVKCTDGWLFEGTRKAGVCPKCKGSGLKTRISALGEMIISPEEAKTLDLDKVLKYVSPEVTTLEFLDKKIEKYNANARQILHLNSVSDSNVNGASGNETAADVWTEQKNHYAFIKPISDQIFYIYEFVLNAIAKIRYNDIEDRLIVNPPTNFEFNTEDDYIQQISVMKAAGVPDVMIYPIIYKFLSSVYYTDVKTMAIFKLLVNSDRLLLMSNDQINSGVATKSILTWEKYLHDSATILINELVMKDSKFLEMDIEKQIEQLKALAQEKTPVTPLVEQKPVNLFP